MTTVAAMICADGIVIGSDTKAVGGDIKWSANKLFVEKLGKSPLVIGTAGAIRHCQDAVRWMELGDLATKLKGDPSFDNFLDTVIESTMPQFVEDFKRKYGDEPEVELLIACIDGDGSPKLVQVYQDGDYERIDNCAAAGTGSIFGEILLRKLYEPNISIQFAERLIAYIIWEVQGIDNNSGENMQIIRIGKDMKKHEASTLDIEAYKQLPCIVSSTYKVIGQQIETVSLDGVKDALDRLQVELGKLNTTEENDGRTNRKSAAKDTG